MAQSPRVGLGAGVGIANPFNSDFEFSAAAWEASLQLYASRHMAFEFAVNQWRHSTDETFGQTVQHTSRTRRLIALSFLGTGGTGRAAFFAGGGVGFFAFRRVFTQTFGGSTTSNVFNSDTLSLQGTAGADVAVVSRLRVFGQGRVQFPVSDVGNGDSSLVAGVRFVF